MRCRDERGFSLVELVVVMAIMGVVFGSVSLLLVRGTTVQSHLNARFEAQTDARVALDRLRADARCAQFVSGSASSITLTRPTACDGGGSISWCTAATGSVFDLYREAGTTCGSGGVRFADHLTTGSVFTLSAQSPTSLATLAVQLPVSRLALRPTDGYVLRDTLVLRNSSRT